MSKESFLIFVLSSILINSSFAINVSPFEIPKKQVIQDSKNTQNANQSKHPNLSGSWSGRCSKGGESEDTRIIIKHTDDYIEIYERRFDLNVLNTIERANASGTGMMHVIVKWDDENRLVLRASITNYSPWSNNNQLDYGSIQLSYALANDKLVINGESSYYFDHVAGFPDEENHDKFECTLEKEGDQDPK